MSALAMFGLGLIPKRALVGAGLVAAVMGAALVERQCTVMDLDRQLGETRKGLQQAQVDVNDCREQVGGLKQINEQLAAAADRQNRAVQAWIEAAAQRERDAAEALRVAQTAAAGERAQRARLESALLDKDKHVRSGECEAAAGVRVVREGLSR